MSNKVKLLLLPLLATNADKFEIKDIILKMIIKLTVCKG